MKKEKIFIGVYEVAGYFQNLFLGLDSLGFDVGYLNLSNNKFQYDSYIEKNYKFLNFVSYQFKIKNPQLKYLFFLKLIYLISLRALVFVWCLFKFDVFIFSSGKSFFKFYDCKLIKLFNKKIIFVSLGSDTRPSFLNGKYKDEDVFGAFNSFKCNIENKKIKSCVQKIEKYATHIINYPQHGHFHTRKFISGNLIGFPTNFVVLNGKLKNAISSLNKDKVKIIHAPSRPLVKGSIHFREIINSLIEEGFKIEYVELIGKSNAEVLAEIKSCDLVLDELYSDLPLGGLGSEAGLFAKPVIVFGYFSCEIDYINNLEYFPPSFYNDPDEAKSVIKKIIENKKLREEAGLKLYHYILNNWNIKNVAKKFADIISGNHPENWVIDPLDISYLYGWGISKRELKQNIKVLIEDFGIESLNLNHNPKLMANYLKFIELND